jgi:hypothetical protein
MAWLVFCNYCGVSFVVNRETAPSQSYVPEGRLLLACDKCGQTSTYSASDVRAGTEASAN